MGLTDDQRERFERLHSAILSDVTDEMGVRENVIPCTGIRALWSRDPVVGTAHTLQAVEIGYQREYPESATDDVVLSALDRTGEGDVIVYAAPDGTQVGLWGELLSTAVAASGGVGAVIDGPTRDSRLIEDHGFPVWARGHSAIESFSRVDPREFGVPVEIEGVSIAPGDVVFADYESIVVIDPDDVEAVLERAEADIGVEDDVRADLRAGRPITEVWDEYETL